MDAEKTRAEMGIDFPSFKGARTLGGLKIDCTVVERENTEID